MLIIPAVDLHNGCVVRFVQGARDRKVYSRDPLKTARHWAKQGAEMLHVVDLDGAFTGMPKNIRIVEDIIRNAGVPVEIGGGLRDLKIMTSLIKQGAARVVLGTKAIADPKFLKMAMSKFKNRVIVSIDAKDGIVMVEGWKKGFRHTDAIKFGNSLKTMGIKEVIYTDTKKDGTLTGPNIKGLKEFLKRTGLKVVASGGISELKDLTALKRIEKLGVTGVIVGKALYEGRFTLPQALGKA